MSINCILNYSNLTVDIINQHKNKYIEEYEKLVENVINTPDEELSWLNIMKPFNDFENRSIELSALLEMKDFYLNEEIREKCSEISTELSKWAIDISMRKDLYEKYKYYETNKFESEKLTEEEQTAFKDMMLDYSLKGLFLNGDNFDRLKEIKKEISELCSQFSLNLSNEKHTEYIKIEDLDGLPEKYLNDRRQDNMIKVTLKYPDIIPLMEYCKIRDTRKKFSTLFKSRCIEENTPIIEKVFKLRGELANLLSFPNYSDYKLVRSMAGSRMVVMDFLNDLLSKVKPLLHNDFVTLNKLHQEHGHTDSVQMWDIAFYSRIYTERTCNFDKEELKQYFPVAKVISGALSIYQKLLGFKFEKIEDLNHTFWDESVELYRVTTCDNSSNELLVGYFYLDLYPREGKYSHAACFPFITKSDVTVPVATMGCNFGRGNMTFDEVETFFHEFGHVMHHLSSESQLKSTASFSCEHDFVETPSQMFEEWCYSPETLTMMSENLPLDVIDKLNQSRKLLQGYHYARQLMFGIFDMTIHSAEFQTMNLTPAELFSKIQKQVLEMDTIPNTSEPASFGHLMGGYDAGYYGYAWSLAYAKDLFSMFKDNKLLDSDLGMKLRKVVLSKGSMRKSMESIKLFLEREPSNEEFIRSIC